MKWQEMMRWGIGITALICSASAVATDKNMDVRYGPTPAWVKPLPEIAPPPAPESSAIQLLSNDIQTRFSDVGGENYFAYRMKILSPEGLQFGNIMASWHPAIGSVTVHYLRIVRDGKTIDILADNRFHVVQREGSLEQSMLTGFLTATLQVPGLQIGDTIEFAATTLSRDPTLGDRRYGHLQMPTASSPAYFRAGLQWPAKEKLRIQSTPDMPAPTVTEKGGFKYITLEMDKPSAATPTDGAPTRDNIRRLIEFSDFTSWGEISQRFYPLFQQAAKIPATSSLRQEVERIAKSSADPLVRAGAALKFAQDNVRYVYVGLNDGNYMPATIEQTWARRYGDCKAKTALLMAMLTELGIENEAAMVNPQTSDGTNERLPTPLAFNHVLVRARIGGQTYWLDATGQADSNLARLDQPAFRWALPLRSAGAELEAVATPPPPRPQLIEIVDIDAKAGYDVPAQVKAVRIVRGPDAKTMLSALRQIDAKDMDAALKSYARENDSWFDPKKTMWRYEQDEGALVLTIEGTSKLDWEKDTWGYSYNIPGAGFIPPDKRERPAEQKQDSNWTTSYPTFNCWVTTIRLPPPTSGKQWDYASKPMDRQIGGTAYWRRADLRDGVMRTVMSRRTMVPEITSAEAKINNGAIETFDSKMSEVFETKKSYAATMNKGSLAAIDTNDWVKNSDLCMAPTAK